MHELQGWPGCAWVMGTNWNLAIITVLKLLIKLDMLNGVGFPLKNDLLFFFYQFVEQESGRWGESFETNEKEKTWILGFVDISTKKHISRERRKQRKGRNWWWSIYDVKRMRTACAGKSNPKLSLFTPRRRKANSLAFGFIYIYI
jgi:hypothetical protein